MITIRKFGALWCGPCKALSAVFTELKELYKNKDVTFIEYDVDEQPESVLQYNITGLPTIIVEKNYDHVKTIKGIQHKNVYIETINNIL